MTRKKSKGKERRTGTVERTGLDLTHFSFWTLAAMHSWPTGVPWV